MSTSIADRNINHYIKYYMGDKRLFEGSYPSLIRQRRYQPIKTDSDFPEIGGLLVVEFKFKHRFQYITFLLNNQLLRKSFKLLDPAMTVTFEH